MTRYRLLFQFAGLLAALGPLPAATLTLTAPLEYQVIQRERRDTGDIEVRGALTGSEAKDIVFEWRIAVDGTLGEWRTLPAAMSGESFTARVNAPAGGWHRLQVRAVSRGETVAETTVEHVGVGEIFVVAGQSNSANHGQERQSTESGRVVTFDGARWQLCNDPQPGASGQGGSFLPPFGDAMAQRFGVPVGFIACGIGATSVREWLPKGVKFPNPPTLTSRVQRLPDGQWESNGTAFDRLVSRMRQLGSHGFRAVLWHQGESDANQQDPTRTLPGKLYREYLTTLIRESRRAIGWEAPWFVAQVSYHTPGDEGSADIRAAQASLWTDGIALPGPDSDALKGDLRENGGKGVHFSGPGLRAHAAAWVDKVAPWLEQQFNEEPRATLTVDTEAPRVPYSRFLFGGFIEHFDGQIYGGLFEPGSSLSDERGFRKDVIAALKELKLSIVRWPGGCFASGYHWKQGIGQPRRPVPDPVWGVVDPNTFGTDEFVEWCRRAGCEPYICSNAGNGTPEEMRDWVEYCNGTGGEFARMRQANGHTPPLAVRYWSIGNENWGGHEIGARTPGEWGPLVARAADLMRSADPGLKLLAAATPNRDWTMPLLRAAGNQLQYIAIHEYWLPCWSENLTPDYLTCILRSGGPETTISRVIELLDDAGCRGRVKIAFDEWNLRGWHHPGFPRKEVSDPGDSAVAALIRARERNAVASQYTMADALFSASFLNACLRHAEDVGMANIAPIVNTRGPLFVHPGGIVKRTTFHTLALYANELEDRVARLDLNASLLVHGGDGLQVLDEVATTDDSGRKWAFALVNRDPSRAVSCAIKLKGARLDGPRAATVLAGDSPDAYNDVEHPERVMPELRQLLFTNGVVKVPPHSLTILKVRLE